MMEVNKWPVAFLRKPVQKKLRVKEHNLSYEARKAASVGVQWTTDAVTAFAETIQQLGNK